MSTPKNKNVKDHIQPSISEFMNTKVTPNPEDNKPNNKRKTPPSMEPQEGKKVNRNVTPSSALLKQLELSDSDSDNTQDEQTNMDVKDKKVKKGKKDNVLKAMLELFKSLESKLNDVAASQQELKTKFIDEDKHAAFEVKTLTNRIRKVEQENKKLTDRISKLEDKLLENNIILRGVHEAAWESNDVLLEKIWDILSDTVLGRTYEDRIKVVKTMLIKSARRLGRYNPMRSRPIVLEFIQKHDADYVLQNKRYLPFRIFADREYSRETELQRRQLRPYLRAAQKLPQYNRKCKLEASTLVIKGTNYTVSTIHELPSELNAFNISSRKNSNVLGFFGKMNVLSNFYPCEFEHLGIKFNSSEQLIQYVKAEFCEDSTTAKQILECEDALSCKKVSKNINNFNMDSWSEAAKELCESGISAKFEQNEDLKTALLSTGSKTLVECCYDKLWGNGVPLHEECCLTPDMWYSQGLLGEILEDTRSKLRSKENQVVLARNSSSCATISINTNTDIEMEAHVEQQQHEDTKEEQQTEHRDSDPD